MITAMFRMAMQDLLSRMRLSGTQRLEESFSYDDHSYTLLIQEVTEKSDA